MKPYLILLIAFCLCTKVYSQNSDDVLKGSVSFISSKNVYVKFESTDGLRIGDTLFISQNNLRVPVLVVNNLSSISCVGTPISENKLTISTSILGKKRVELKKREQIVDKTKAKESVSVNDQAVNEARKMKEDKKNSKSDFDGRLSLTSYSNISGSQTNQRYRYNLSLNAQHIKDSKFSFDSYISFSHRSTDFPDTTHNIFNYLKIYSLSVKYDINKSSNLTLGRNINVNMANIGAVDGLQYEKRFKNITYGALVGFRPDYTDYSFNSKLLQYGGFVSHNVQKTNGYMQTSFALFNQMNGSKTDRRFGYIQHSNSLLKNVDLFSSFEFDFYTLKNLQPASTFDLTSSYISLRYKPFRKLSLSVSYDARKNIYYYETFKNQIDSILDREMRKGYRAQFLYRPFRWLNWGGWAGYRSQKSDLKPSINANTYLLFPQLPWIKTALNLNATLLRTNYLDGMIYGGSLSRDFLDGKIYGELGYRMVNYQNTFSKSNTLQNIGELSFSWRVAKKTMLSTDFELNLEKNNNAGRVFVNLTQRF